ncbi:hypothetical protein BDA99DRAFT_608005 [Phascolomyces articulosus]|uniref:C2H2-type domain-containing protein n=1 Tax=Phascolomyces articulosus TaxID=60185 RepID=A0AAD5K2G7_9FUNG|nr:hypothetical protein BDA99DRAFT_608005 [Phascolomyces articulosus]
MVSKHQAKEINHHDPECKKCNIKFTRRRDLFRHLQSSKAHRNENTAYYNVDPELRSPFTIDYRVLSATFVRNNILYFYGGSGPRTTVPFRQIVPYFQSIEMNPINGSVVYSTVMTNQGNDTIEQQQQQQPYDNYTAGSAAVLLSDNERVLFFGGIRNPNRAEEVEGNLALYLDQYDFRTQTWTSLPVQLAPQYIGSSSVLAPPRNRVYLGATLAPNGKVYISNGRPIGNVTDTYDFWEYDPEVGTFSPIPEAGLFIPDTYMYYYPYQGGTVTLPDGRILYVTDISNYIRIFDTNTNQLIHQEVKGYENIYGGSARSLNTSLSMTDIRYGGYATLAPNHPSHVYFYGGCIMYEVNEECRNDIVILDIENWTWILPTTKTQGIPPRGRYLPTGGVVNINDENYMIITHGYSSTARWFNDINVLRLPSSNDINNNETEKFMWVTNITDNAIMTEGTDAGDYYSNLFSNETQAKNFQNMTTTLVAGDIVGIVIGCITAISVVILVLCRWDFNVVTAVTETGRYLIWDPRVGEPSWAEAAHLVTKILLCCIFAAYITYTAILISESPISTLTLITTADRIYFPDIRICVQGFSSVSYLNFESDSTIAPLQAMDSGFIRQLEQTQLGHEQNMTHGPLLCWLFVPPKDTFYLTRREVRDGGVLRIVFDGQLADEGEADIYVELYPHGANPNLVVYESMDQPNLSKQDLEDWMRIEFNDIKTGNNRYRASYRTSTSISFQERTRRYLTEASWNTVGFASIYESQSELVTSFQTTIPNNDTIAGTVFDFYPTSVMSTTLQEQRIYTLFTTIGPVAGILGLLFMFDRLLFGARPRSPWGVVHRMSMGMFRDSLHKQLRKTFGFLHRPIPFIDPVDNRLFTNHEPMMDVHGLARRKKRNNIDNDDEDDENTSYRNSQLSNDQYILSSIPPSEESSLSSRQPSYYYQQRRTNSNITYHNSGKRIYSNNTSTTREVKNEAITTPDVLKEEEMMSPSGSSAGNRTLVPSASLDLSHGERIQALEDLVYEQQQEMIEQQRRFQLMELMLKAYYIAPEILENLNNAHDDSSLLSSSHQQNRTNHSPSKGSRTPWTNLFHRRQRRQQHASTTTIATETTAESHLYGVRTSSRAISEDVNLLP